jgi:hypothetical protein
MVASSIKDTLLMEILFSESDLTVSTQKTGNSGKVQSGVKAPLQLKEKEDSDRLNGS